MGEQELFDHFKEKVDEGQNPLRVDKFLMDRLPNFSRTKLKKAAEVGGLKVNGNPEKVNYKVRPGDEVVISLPHPVREFELISEDIPLDIVYEDDTLVVINKPWDMVVHPGHGNYSGTLANALIYHFNKLPVAPGNPESRPGLVHRLDKHTTGLMVVAKTEGAMAHLSEQFANRTTDRRYNALVWGDVKEDEGTIESFMGRSPKNRKVFMVFEEEEMGKHAITHYKVLKRWGYVTLVECKLDTGRTHQIRVHMKSIGHTLFNDIEYGGDKILKGASFSKYKNFIENNFKLTPGQVLHAKTLGFTHPVTGERMHFDSELNEGMQAVIERWDRYLKNRDLD